MLLAFNGDNYFHSLIIIPLSSQLLLASLIEHSGKERAESRGKGDVGKKGPCSVWQVMLRTLGKLKMKPFIEQYLWFAYYTPENVRASKMNH